MPILGPGVWSGEDLLPSFAISINNHEIDENIVRLVQSVEYDSADNIADMMKLKISNPEFVVSDKKIFQTGNVIKLWAGFNELKYIGAAIIEKVRPYFPSDGMPTIDIVAYSADRLMMRNSPDSSDEKKPFMTDEELKEEREKAHKAKVRGYQLFRGRKWDEGTLYSDVIIEKAEAYGFKADVDETPDYIVGPAGVIQKVGMTDYQLAAGVANELIWLFWVDMPEDGDKWVLHFKDPNGITEFSEVQEEKFTFRYNSTTSDASVTGFATGPTTLLEFDGEQEMGNGPTDLKIQIKNPKTGNLESYSVVGDPADETVEYVNVPNEAVLEPPETTHEVSLSFNNVAVKVIADRIFTNPAQVKAWAEAWYKENHRDFFKGTGTVRGPGAEKLRAMQVHEVGGLGVVWSGDYYFVNVIHKINAQDGYSVEWHGRKITKAAISADSDFATATANIELP